MKRKRDFCGVFLQVDGDFDVLVLEERSSEEEMIEQHAKVVHFVDEAILRLPLDHYFLVEKTVIFIIKSELFVSELLQNQLLGVLACMQ